MSTTILVKQTWIKSQPKLPKIPKKTKNRQTKTTSKQNPNPPGSHSRYNSLNMKENPRHINHEVLVTGAHAGIGKAIAELLNQHGAKVFGIDISFPDQIDLEVGGAENHYLSGWAKTSVTDLNSLHKIAGETTTPIDILIIAAGIPQPGNTKEKIVNVNYNGAVNTWNAFSGRLPQGATLIFVGSDAINDEDFKHKNYRQSKILAHEFIMGLVEKRPDLRILELLPGPVNTALFRADKPAEVIERIDKHVGIMTPEYIAQVLVDQILPDPDQYPSGSAVRIYQNQTNHHSS